MASRNTDQNTSQYDYRVRLFIFLFCLAACCFLLITVMQSAKGSPSVDADRYYLRVSGCDDGGRAFLNNQLMVDVGFDEDSNWLDITEDVAKGKDEIKFEVINKTGAITYLFQVKKNDTIVFEEACGKAKLIGCENNRAFRVGAARRFIYKVRRER